MTEPHNTGSFCSPKCRKAYASDLRFGISGPTTTEAGRCIYCGKATEQAVTEPDDTGCAIRPPTFIVEIDSGIDEWVRVLSPDEPMDGFEDESKAWALARKLYGTVQVRVRDIDWSEPDHPVDVLVDLCTREGFELDPERVAEMRAVCDAPVGWTTAPPTKPGWYWLRAASEPMVPTEVWYRAHEHGGHAPGLMVTDCAFDPPIVQPPEFVRGEWFSEPIAEPPA